MNNFYFKHFIIACLEKSLEFDVTTSILLHTTLGKDETRNMDHFSW